MHGLAVIEVMTLSGHLLNIDEVTNQQLTYSGCLLET